ncbi:MAG: hypothetical protein ACI4C3_10160 [Bacteroides sp.]
MENILIFCIVMLAIGLKALVDKPKKEAEKQQPDLSDIPDLSDMDMPELHYPLPEEGVRSTSPIATLQKDRKASQAGRKARQAGGEAASSTNAPLATPPEAGCEFANPSAEELRRAVIWSEILQRKY